MNEISLRVTIASLLSEGNVPPDKFMALAEDLLVWFKEGQELDGAETSAQVVTLGTVQ